MKNCCTPTFWEFFKIGRKSFYTKTPVMKCKKHNKNVFLSKRDYKRVRRLSLFKGPAFMIFLVTYLYFFIKGLKVLPVAIVGTLILATYFVICYSFYKKTCKNKKYYHISNDPEFLYYKFDYRKNSK